MTVLLSKELIFVMTLRLMFFFGKKNPFLKRKLACMRYDYLICIISYHCEGTTADNFMSVVGNDDFIHNDGV